MSELKIGVFVCACGERISAGLDLAELERQVAGIQGVAAVMRLPYGCSPDGLAAIRSAIAEQGLNRVLVAGCTPRTLAPRFRRACEAAGLDGALFELADIREGCAWVHPGARQVATRKAADIIRMAVARLAPREAQAAVSAAIVPAALVVGGGLAGMTAALTLARAGIPVTLVEREAALGGMLRQAHTVVPDRRCAAGFLAEKATAVRRQPGIRVLLQSRVTGVTGTAGHYAVTIAQPGQAGDTAIEVGAIIVATGARIARPQGRFGYDGRRVLTQLEFDAELQGREHSVQHPARGQLGNHKGREALNDVVMLLCAGQRIASGGGSHPGLEQSRGAAGVAVSYCSGTCCAAAFKQALEVKAASPEARVAILCRDLCIEEGDGSEEAARQAKRAGVEFIQYQPARPPQVSAEAVEVHDGSTGRTRRLAYDRLVLATPLVPQADAAAVAHLLGLAQDRHGFFAQPRYRLRPETSPERGIYICGAAHGPTDWVRAEFQATSAGFSALRCLRAGMVETHAPVPAVDEALCSGCGTCVGACPFGAISLRPRAGVLSLSQIDPLRCKGCGSCAVACPVKAIALPIESDQAVLAQIEAALSSAPDDGQPRILALGCEWSGHAAAELAGARRLAYPAGVRLIRVGCSARFDPMHVLWAFANGAAGVFLGACPPGQCHYAGGNQHAQARMETLRGLLAAGGLDPRRLRFDWVTPDDAQDFVAKITAFTALIAALDAAPVRKEHTAAAAASPV